MKCNFHNSFSYYFCHINKYLYKSNFIQGILTIIESLLTLTQFIEIYNYNFLDNNTLKINKISISFKLLKTLNKISENFIFAIITFIILLFDTIYYFYDIIFYSNESFSFIFINFMELFYFRIFIIFYLTIIFSFQEYYSFFISFLILCFHIILCINHFQFFHIYYYSPIFISFPYDCFSSNIDIINIIIKVLVSISLNTRKNISIFFYYFSVIIYFISSLYFLYIMFQKSFHLMNNIYLSKIRIHLFFSTFIILLIIIFIDKKNIISLKLFIFVFFIFLILFIIIYQYNPYKYIIISNDKNQDNAFYYLFTQYSTIENKIKLYEKINLHINICNNCKICESFKKNKLLNNIKNKAEQNLFNIIYSEKNKYLNLINEIMKIYKNSKWEFIQKYPNIYIYILYLYYSIILKKKHKNIKLNIELIYYIFQEHNKIIINKEKLLIDQLKDINEFMRTSKTTIIQIKKILSYNPMDTSYQLNDMFYLSDLLVELKSKKYESLFSNKNFNPSNNSFYTLYICIILYEEIFNESIGNKFQQIRENFSQYDDTIFYLYKKNNYITLELNYYNFDFHIIRCGKELISYLNRSLYELFPKNLMKMQKKEIMKKLLDFQINHKALKTTSIAQEKYLNIQEIQLLIILKKNNKIFYRALILHIHFLFKDDISKTSIFNGKYFIYDDIILTKIYKKINNSEFIIGFPRSNYHNPYDNDRKILLHDFLNINNLKKQDLTLFFSKKNDEELYNIYRYKQEKSIKESTFTSGTLLELKGMETILEHSFIKENKKKDESSINDSFHSKTDNYGSGIKLKKYLNHNKKNKYDLFRYIQIIQIIFLFLIIVLSLIQIIHQSKLKNKLNNEYLYNNNFKLFYKTFYHMFSSFLSVLCIGVSPNSLECINIFDKHNQYYLNKENIITLNFTKIIQAQNQLLSDKIGIYLKNFVDSVNKLNDKEITNTMNSQFNYKQVLQRNNLIYVINNNMTLYEALTLIINSFYILKINDNQYMNDAFYIINYKENLFKNIKPNHKISDAHFEIYHLLLNYHDYVKYLKIIRLRFDKVIDIQINKFKTITYNYTISIFLLKIISVVILIVYIYFTDRNFINIINSIKKKLKQDNKYFRQTYTQKIRNLEKLIYMYIENPIDILSNLDKIYENYKTTMNKIKKKKYNNPFHYKTKYLLKLEKLNLFSLKTLRKNGINKIYYNFIIMIFISIIIIFIIEIIYWSNCFFIIKRVFYLIEKGFDSEVISYRMFSYLQLILYCNQTEEEISTIIEVPNFDNLIQNTLFDFYQIHQKKAKVKKYLLFLNDCIEINCNTFYILANNSIFNIINEEFPEEQFFENLAKYCLMTKAMEKKRANIIYQQHLGLINDAIHSIKIKTYDGIIRFLELNYLFKCELFSYFIYRPIRKVVEEYISMKGIENIMNLLEKLFDISIIIEIIHELCLILIVIIVFITKLEKRNRELFYLKNVFTITNY